MTKQRERTGAIRRGLGQVDTLVWVLLGVGLVAGLFLLLVLAIPPAASSLSVDLFDSNTRMARVLIAPPEQASEIPQWLSVVKPASEGEADHDGEDAEDGEDDNEHRGEEGKAKQLAAQHAKNAGVLALLKRSSGSHIASLFGRDSALSTADEDALGGLVGSAVAESYGLGGLGPVGTGRHHKTADGFAGINPKAPQHAPLMASVPARTRQHAPALPADPEKQPPNISVEKASAAPADKTITAPPRRQEHRSATQAFLAERERVAGLTFQQPTGYWANTYVPGDPAMRSLQAHLAGFDRKQLARVDGKAPRLDAAARPYRQAFDRPRGSALGLFVHADRRAARGPARTLLQVGLQGTARYGGRRPEMKIAVVLDWRQGTAATVSASVRALLLALARARDVGDRFTLTVAGRPASRSVSVPAGDFRHGALVVALQRLEATTTTSTQDKKSSGLTLTQAVRQASSSLDAADPTAPPSSNLVLLVVTGDLGGELRALGRLTHENAVAGIPTSVVGVGHGVEADQLTGLVLAGQGNRRMLTKPAQAAGLIDRELSAAAGVIARALRLHIRLAPGVKLVDVLGSYPLDRAAAQRVREAEQSIDLRVARNLGLTADRGEDDEGIQIVIPAFHAGDAHVVLLDVVTPGPGPVADVTVRYKDLVHLRNSVARAHLSLARGSLRRGPLEQGVLKNLLSHRSSRALGRAGELLGRGHRERAIATLERWRGALANLHAGAGVTRDPDIQGDLAMLKEYSTLLRGLPSRSRQAAHLAGSLIYASYLKVVPRRPPGGAS